MFIDINIYNKPKKFMKILLLVSCRKLSRKKVPTFLFFRHCLYYAEKRRTNDEESR